MDAERQEARDEGRRTPPSPAEEYRRHSLGHPRRCRCEACDPADVKGWGW